jgi:hypothetical protein
MKALQAAALKTLSKTLPVAFRVACHGSLHEGSRVPPG